MNLSKRSNKKNIILGLILLITLATLSGCATDPQNYSTGDLTITLTKQFTEIEKTGFDMYLESDNVIFSAIEETYEELENVGYEYLSLEDYCSELLSANKIPEASLTKRGAYYYFSNEKTISNVSYTYVHCMFMGDNSYWLCAFACKTKDYKKFQDDIIEWADSVVIDIK